MIGLPTMFLLFAATALVCALIALFHSVRTALGGGAFVLIETARDLPDHAALVEEKKSLLRAIKDLEYERAVGKIGDADFTRLDGAYRARAKQVLAQLDRDVQPLYEEAERLIADRIAGRAGGDSAKSKKKKGAASAKSAGGVGATASLDDVLLAIRDGAVDGIPDPPPDWPPQAKQFWTDTLTKALEDHRAKIAVRAAQTPAPGAGAATGAAAETATGAAPAAEPDVDPPARTATDSDAADDADAASSETR